MPAAAGASQEERVLPLLLVVRAYAREADAVAERAAVVACEKGGSEVAAAPP